MTRSTVCVDASLVAKLVLPEPETPEVDSLWGSWIAAGLTIVAPSLLTYEVASAIRKRVHRKLINVARGAEALEAFRTLAEEVTLVPPDELHSLAWDLGCQYERPNLYDSYYVALAIALDCDLWSADERLRRAMPSHAGRIRSVQATSAGLTPRSL